MIESPINELEERVRCARIARSDALKCEYKDKCEAYKSDSQTCVEEPNKKYCGIYRDFAAGRISKWVKSHAYQS